jgi:hypothetical protein
MQRLQLCLWTFQSRGIRCRVDWYIGTTVSEESAASETSAIYQSPRRHIQQDFFLMLAYFGYCYKIIFVDQLFSVLVSKYSAFGKLPMLAKQDDYNNSRRQGNAFSLTFRLPSAEGSELRCTNHVFVFFLVYIPDA